MDNPPLLELASRVAFWAALLGGLVSVGWAFVGWRARPGQKEKVSCLVWLALGGVALLLRLLSPFGFIAENHHGEQIFLSALEISGLTTYGQGYVAFFGPLLAIWGHPDVLFFTNAGLGATASVLTGLLVWRLLPMKLGSAQSFGWAAALLMAVLPVHARVSSTGSPFVLGSVLALSAAVLALVTVQRRSGVWWLAACAFAAASVHVRPMFVLLAPMMLMATFTVSGWRCALSLRWWCAGLLVLAVLSLPRGVEFALWDSQSHHFEWTQLLSNIVSSYHLILNPRLFPLGITCLALCAVVFGRTRSILWLVGCILVLAGYYLALYPSFSCILRFQVGGLFLYLTLAALGYHLLRVRLSARWLAAVAGFVVLSVLVTTPILTFRVNSTEQYSYLRRWAPELPKKGVLVVPSRLAKGRILTYFPSSLLPDSGRGWQIVTPNMLSHIPAELHDAIYYFRGISAYSFALDEMAALEDAGAPLPSLEVNPYYSDPIFDRWDASREHLLRPEIVAFEQGAQLEAVPNIPVHTFDNHPIRYWAVPQRKLSIGFFRVTANRLAPPQGEHLKQAERLLRPLAPGDQLTEEFRLWIVEVSAEELVFALDEEGQPPLMIRLMVEPRWGPPYARTRRYFVYYESASGCIDDVWERGLRSFVRLVQGNDPA